MEIKIDMEYELGDAKKSFLKASEELFNKHCTLESSKAFINFVYDKLIEFDGVWRNDDRYIFIMNAVNILWKFKEDESVRKEIIILCKEDCKILVELLPTIRFGSAACLNRLIQLDEEDGNYDEAIKLCKIGVKYKLKGVSEKRLTQIEKKASENESKKR